MALIAPRLEFKLTGPDGEDKGPEIAHFIELLGLDRIAPGRYSTLLVIQLFGGFKSRTQNYNKVIREIEALEGIRAASRLKPPIQNKHPPLRGLWHKHYMQDGIASMARNIQHGLRRHGIPLFTQRAEEAAADGKLRYVSQEDIGALAHDVVTGNWQRLSAAQALTGEWLLFAKHAGQNYYLDLGTHDKSTHENVRSQIDAIYCKEFPFLTLILDGGDTSLAPQEATE